MRILDYQSSISPGLSHREARRSLVINALGVPASLVLVLFFGFMAVQFAVGLIHHREWLLVFLCVIMACFCLVFLGKCIKGCRSIAQAWRALRQAR
jgi:hypothetical protein